MTVTGKCNDLEVQLYTSSDCTGTFTSTAYDLSTTGPQLCVQNGNASAKILKCHKGMPDWLLFGVLVPCALLVVYALWFLVCGRNDDNSSD